MGCSFEVIFVNVLVGSSLSPAENRLTWSSDEIEPLKMANLKGKRLQSPHFAGLVNYVMWFLKNANLEAVTLL